MMLESVLVSFFYKCDQFSQHHLLKKLSFFHCISLPPFSKIRCLQARGFISGLSILFHLSIFLSLCEYHTVLMTVALQYSLKSGRLIPPVPFFFLKITLAIQGFLYFHTNCEIICSSSVKNTVYHSFLIHSSASGHLGCLYVLAFVNSAAMNLGVHVSLSILVSLVCMPNSGIAGLYCSSISSF